MWIFFRMREVPPNYLHIAFWKITLYIQSKTKLLRNTGRTVMFRAALQFVLPCFNRFPFEKPLSQLYPIKVTNIFFGFVLKFSHPELSWQIKSNNQPSILPPLLGVCSFLWNVNKLQCNPIQWTHPYVDIISKGHCNFAPSLIFLSKWLNPVLS